MVKQNHDTPHPPYKYPRLERIFTWTGRIAAGSLAAVLVTPSVSPPGIAAGVASQDKQIISSQPKAPSSVPKIPTSPSATEPLQAKPVDIPFGIPDSYVLNAKALGGIQGRVVLRHMTCPQDCNKGDVVNRVQLYNPDPPDFGNVYSFTFPEAGLNQGNVNLAHATEIPSNAEAFAGQNFAQLQQDDQLSQTNISTVTFSVGGYTAKIQEYVTRDYTETDSVTSTKGTDQIAKNLSILATNQVMFATCGVPDDTKNEVRVFTENGHMSMSPLNPTQAQVQMSNLVYLAHHAIF